MLRLQRTLILTLILCLAASPVLAQKTGVEAVVIGDGARECSDAKSALFTEMPWTEGFSAASTNIDIRYYRLNLTLPMVDNSLSGVVRVEGTVVNSPMSTLVLDLQDTMDVASVTLANGTPLTFSHPGAVLNINFPAPIAPGGNVAVDITYSGFPQSGGFGYFVFGIRNGDRYAWSLSEPYGAREWWPCKDHPSDKADSVRVIVTVPSIYRVGSQGLLVESTNGGNKTYDWFSDYPISNYLVSISVGDYTRYLTNYTRPAPLAGQYGPLNMPLDHLVYNDGSNALPNGWNQVGDMIAVFEEWFGPYPFAQEKYGHAETTFGGGMEHQTMSSMGGSSISLTSHELAHQWYGDNISPRTWPHLWLNEGFATYGALLYFQQRSNLYPGIYESQLATTMNSALTAAGTLVVEDTVSVSNLFASSRVYNKGGSVLYMLRWIVGDTTFRNIMKAYSADPAVQYDVATTADFKRVCETVSGLDLDTFFAQWVETGTGYPTYTACSLWLPEDDLWRVQVTLHQVQTLPQSNVNVFVMPVHFVIHTTGGDVSDVVVNSERDQTFVFFTPDQPTSVEIDPERRILRDTLIGSGACGPIGTAVGPPPIRTDIARIYPNPASSAFHVQYSVAAAGEIDLGVYDVAGRRVLSKSIARSVAGAGSELFDASSLPAGIYFLKMRAPRGEAITRKLVIVR